MKRLASKNDLEQVYSIYFDELVIPYLGYDPMPIEEFTPIYHSFLDVKNFYVYEKSGGVVGFFRVTLGSGRTKHLAYLATLAVNPSYHGQGVSSEMVLSLIDELKATGIRRIELRVESDNNRAISFYKKIGFKIEGTLRQYYKRSHEDHYVDDHIMGLLLY